MARWPTRIDETKASVIAYNAEASSNNPVTPIGGYNPVDESGAGSADPQLLQGDHVRLSTNSRMFSFSRASPTAAGGGGFKMEEMFSVSAGIDVHRDTLMVSIRSRSKAKQDDMQTRTFETYHDSLVELTAWLAANDVEVVGLESTGVYWKPVVRELQQRSSRLIIWLVNPAEVKKVPGRKTDVSDSQWLSKLVMYGLVSPSYLASTEQDGLRMLTRLRTKVVADRTRSSNRVLKHIETSGIKLASVCSNVLGKTGRCIIDAMLEGVDDVAVLAGLAKGSLRNKKPALMRAVGGRLSGVCKFILRELLAQLDETQHHIDKIDAQISALLEPHVDEIELLKTVPGIDDVAAAAILAEIGGDMSLFPDADHLASWAGFSPGSNESAGKSKHAPARQGDKYLRTIVVQASQVTVRTKGTFWNGKFRQLLPRLGYNKAVFAIGRKMVVAIYHILRDQVPYKSPEPVPPSPEKLKRMIQNYTERLASLGLEVTVTPKQVAQTM